MAINPISSDLTANSYTTTSSSFNSSDFAAVIGNVGSSVTDSLSAFGNTSGATISALTTNAAYDSALSLGGSTTYTTGSSLSTGSQYLTGTSSLSSTTDSTATDVESILADSAMSQAYLIGIQAQMGQQQTTFTSISNAMNVKFSMEKEAIRNFKS